MPAQHAGILTSISCLDHVCCTHRSAKYVPGLQCALLANSAGIGGGPFYVPLLTVVLGFDLKAATGLSHTIVGASPESSPLFGRTHHAKGPC